MRAVSLIRLVIPLVAAPLAAQSPGIAVSVVPDRPLIERTATAQLLNFDFLIHNGGPRRKLDRIELSAFDVSDQLLFRRYVAHHGVSPGILTIPKLVADSGERLGVFNPFFSLDPALDLARLRYTLTFTTEAGATADVVEVDVKPVEYRPKTELSVPLPGRVIVYDGHDFYSHHRRVDTSSPLVQRMGFSDNPVRYANDFCVVDAENRLHRGDPGKIEEWFSYGAPVVAPADGIVIAATGAIPENRIEAGKLIYPDNMPADFWQRSMGNHVVIDHGTGEFSHLAHLKVGSVTIRPGDKVRRGQPVGEIGFSGDTGFHVHLHYGLLTGAKYVGARPLPAYFSGFARLLGGKTVKVTRGPVDSGDLILSR